MLITYSFRKKVGLSRGAPQKSDFLRKEYVMSMKVSSIGRFYVPFLALFLSLKVKGDTFLKFLDRITQIEGLNFKKMP